MHKARLAKIIVVAVSVMLLTLTLALPVAGHSGHASCRGFGTVTSGWATGGYADLGFDTPSWKPFTEIAPPGYTGPESKVAGWVAFEHAAFC